MSEEVQTNKESEKVHKRKKSTEEALKILLDSIEDEGVRGSIEKWLSAKSHRDEGAAFGIMSDEAEFEETFDKDEYERKLEEVESEVHNKAKNFEAQESPRENKTKQLNLWLEDAAASKGGEEVFAPYYVPTDEFEFKKKNLGEKLMAGDAQKILDGVVKFCEEKKRQAREISKEYMEGSRTYGESVERAIADRAAERERLIVEAAKREAASIIHSASVKADEMLKNAQKCFSEAVALTSNAAKRLDTVRMIEGYSTTLQSDVPEMSEGALMFNNKIVNYAARDLDEQIRSDMEKLTGVAEVADQNTDKQEDRVATPNPGLY